MRFTKKIVERGNITLPSDVREALGIEDGDFVELEVISVLKKSQLRSSISERFISPRSARASDSFSPAAQSSQPTPEENLQ